MCCGSRTVPVVDHLQSKDSVKCETCNEAVENELVIDFLEGGEDAGKRAEEVVEDLTSRILAEPVPKLAV